MSLILSPFVYWAQTETHVTLKVDLKDVKTPNILVQRNQLSFAGRGHGAKGLNEYKFNLDFFAKIDPDASSHKILDSKIDFTLKKLEAAWWPRLISQPQKPSWLKIDFDRWRSEEDLDDEDARDVMQDYPGHFERLQREELGYVKEQTKKVYLIVYNLFQFVGFLYIFIVMAVRYTRDGPASISGTYEAVGSALKFIQLLQYLEAMHPLFGYTKGSVLMPFMQVTGRNFILFIMIEFEERMQTKPVVFGLIAAWTVIELVRYPYYISQLLKTEVEVLTWLRYSLWIPLYPIGSVCEGVIIIRNIPYFEETKRFSMALPNSWNFTFDMPLFMRTYLLFGLLPAIYFLMSYMAKTRRQKLGKRKMKKDN